MWVQVRAEIQLIESFAAVGSNKRVCIHCKMMRSRKSYEKRRPYSGKRGVKELEK